MAVNKVELTNSDGTKNTLIDLSKDTINPNLVSNQCTFHNSKGELQIGEMQYANTIGSMGSFNETVYATISDGIVNIGGLLTHTMNDNSLYAISNDESFIVNNQTTVGAIFPAIQLGNATSEDVAKGKTFTSASGMCINGTMEEQVPQEIIPMAGDYPFWGTNSSDSYAGTTLTKLGETFTVPKSGTYRIKAYFMRANQNGTWQASLYRDGSSIEYNATWTSYKGTLIADVEVIEGEQLEIYARSRGPSYAVHLLGWYVSIDTPLGEL